VAKRQAPRTVAEAVRQYAGSQPDRPAFVATGFEPLTYRNLRDQADEIADCLRLAGFDSGAPIAVALPDGPEAALAIVAIGCAAVAVPIDPRLTGPEIETRLTSIRPGAILVPTGENSAARRAAERHHITVIDVARSANRSLRLRLERPNTVAAAPEGDPNSDAPAFILQTSGTTAEPKLIPYSHRNLLATAARVREWFGLTPADRCLCVSPVHYCHGLTVTVFAPLLSGGSVAFPDDPAKVDMAEWFDALAPTWYSTSPTVHLAVLENASRAVEAKHSLRLAVSGGAPLPGELRDSLQATLGVPILEHYGVSEAAQVSANVPRPGLSKAGTCGIPSPGTIVIVGDDGAEVPSGSGGEILVGGPTVISGYLNAPDLNQAAFVNGWFRTGDIGSIDEDGFLTLHGRVKEIINRGAEKVSPVEIDDALMRHGDVAEAAAFAVSHPRLGEDVAAAVVLRPGATVTPAELRKFLSTQLAWFKIPRRITIVIALPKGATGKIQRRRLRELASSAM
jgi:acyl-CoA synthetase (AMP-forming)/AMP-acid ligase II